MWKSNDVTTVRRPFSNWRIKFLLCSHIINCKNANEIQTKTLTYLYENNTRILRQEWQKNFLRRKKQYKKWIDWVNTFARIESQTLFVQFGLSTHIKNILMIKQSILLWRFFKILKFLSMVSGSFPCSSFTWLPIIDIKSVSKNLSIRKLSIPVIITFRCYW